jgi:hypothetical protein
MSNVFGSNHTAGATSNTVTLCGMLCRFQAALDAAIAAAALHTMLVAAGG